MRKMIRTLKREIKILVTGIFILAFASSAIAQNSYFINKTASPTTVQSGQTVTYTIGYSTATAVTGL